MLPEMIGSKESLLIWGLMRLSKLSLVFLFLIASCSSASSDYCITAFDCEKGEICRQGECVPGTAGDTGNSGDSGDSGNSGDSGDTGNTGNTGDTGNSGDTGNTGNTGNSGNTAEQDDDYVDFDSADDDTDDSDIVEYFCGDSIVNLNSITFSEDLAVLSLDEGTGTTASDSSGKNSNGTINDADWVDGKFGKALQFKGTIDSYINLGYTPPANNFTMMAWVKTDAPHEIDPQQADLITGTSGQNYIFGADNRDTEGGAGVSVGTNGVSVYEHGNGYMPALAVYSGYVGIEWTHIAVTYSEREPRIFVNGKLVVTGLISPKTTVHAPTRIGGGAYGYFNGMIDEIRIVERALTPSEIIDAMGEICDEGAGNVEPGYQTAKTCNMSCVFNSFCGDGVTDSGEICDDGHLNGVSGKCKADCSGYDCIPGTFTFEYTGTEQTWTVPGPGTYSIEAWGGQGRNNHEGNVAGGLGGYSKATVPLTTGDILYIYAGQGGGSGTMASFNGGGTGGTSGCVNAQGGAGGGGSDVRKNSNDLSARVIAAGGGGGAGGNRKKDCGPGAGGGGGGGYFGGGGGGAYEPSSVATGGTQSSGGTGGSGGALGAEAGMPGSLGSGGNGATAITNNQSGNNTAAAGGAGGGTNGNNGINAGNFTGGSGAGGSGFVNAPGNTEGTTQNGVRTGNGAVVITRTCP